MAVTSALTWFRWPTSTYAVIAFYCLFFNPESFAQNVNDILARPTPEKPLNEYALRSWTTRDGLPHNSVNRITQSEEGYLWLATWEGPVRYNGRDFTVFDDIDETKMPEAGALDITINPNTNDIIVAGPRGGLVTFDGDTWQPYKVGSAYVFETVIDNNNQMWTATGAGVYRVSADGNHRHYTVADGLPDVAAFRLYRSEQTEHRGPTIWVGTREGLAYWDAETDRFIQERSIPSSQVRAIRMISNGVMLVASDDGLFYRRPLEQDFNVWPQPIRGPITEIKEGSDGCLWVGTFEYGLGRICNTTQEWISLQDGLPNSHVLDIFRDREDNIWVSTHGGFAQLRKALFTSFTPNHGLHGAYVRSVNTDAEGNIWVGTNDGLSRQTTNGFEPVNGHPVLEALSVLSIVPASTSRSVVYVGSYTEGVLQLTDGNVTAQLSRKNGLISNEIRVVKPLANSPYILVGTPDGLFVAEETANSLRVVKRYTKADGMASDFVTSITEDSDGGLWVGSTNALSYFAPLEGAASWQPEPIDLALFTDARNIFAGTFHANRIWLATAHGVITRSIEEDDWRWLSRDQGLPFDKHFTIDFDADNNLWLGGSRGVLRISDGELSAWLNQELERVNYKLFTEADGMISRQLTTGGPASTIDSNGHIWFASAMGAIKVNPELVEEHAVESPVAVIESVTSDTGTLAWNDTLAPGNTRIGFQYVGLGYHMPEHIEYQVRMIGFDQRWIDRGDTLQTEYTALPPGQYTFSVRTRYPGGDWSAATDFKFTKAAYFYQKPWFWFISVLAMITLTSTVVHIRIRSLKNTRARLQAMVREQTKELEALALQDSLTGLANRRAFDQQLAREVQNSARHNTPLTIALLDLDFFKQINDRFLHAGGDIILKQVASFIADSVREVDHVARWGGEEFAIIFPQTAMEEASQVVERIRLGIEAMRFDKVDSNARVTVSIGITALLPNISAAQLLKQADRALYEAKSKGRNRIVRGYGES